MSFILIIYGSIQNRVHLVAVSEKRYHDNRFQLKLLDTIFNKNYINDGVLDI